MIRVKAIRKLSMKQKFFLTDMITHIDRRWWFTDNQMAWIVAILEQYPSPKDKRIQDAIDALKESKINVLS